MMQARDRCGVRRAQIRTGMPGRRTAHYQPVQRTRWDAVQGRGAGPATRSGSSIWQMNIRSASIFDVRYSRDTCGAS